VVLCTGSLQGTEKNEEESGLEEYVAGILPGQFPLTGEEELLKAQAVIIRTNLLKKAMEYYQTETMSEAAQALQEEDLEEMGFTYYSRQEREEQWKYGQKLLMAVEETAGQVVVCQEQPVDLPYHTVSAGMTRSGQELGQAYTYLEPVECPDDRKSSDYLEIRYLEMDEIPEILERDESGYVTQVRVGEEILGGEEFRSRYELNSSYFTLESTEDGIRITTRGLGHGMGLSLYQAGILAEEGADWLEILMYFYKNVECISFTESGYAMDKI
jgi:stage II sporulation protein D